MVQAKKMVEGCATSVAPFAVTTYSVNLLKSIETVWLNIFLEIGDELEFPFLVDMG